MRRMMRAAPAARPMGRGQFLRGVGATAVAGGAAMAGRARPVRATGGDITVNAQDQSTWPAGATDVVNAVQLAVDNYDTVTLQGVFDFDSVTTQGQGLQGTGGIDIARDGVTLKGPATINGGGACWLNKWTFGPWARTRTVIMVSAKNVKIHDLTIQSPTASPVINLAADHTDPNWNWNGNRDFGSLEIVRVKALDIKPVAFMGLPFLICRAGVWVQWAKGNLLVQDCEFRMSNAAATFYGDTGINVAIHDNELNATIVNNVIEHTNPYVAPFKMGINASGMAHSSFYIKGNTIANPSTGIAVIDTGETGYDATMVNNKIVASTWGLDVYLPQTGCLVMQNHIQMNQGGAAMYLDCIGGAVKANQVTGSSDVGILSDFSKDVVFLGNNLSGLSAPVKYFFNTDTSGNIVKGSAGGSDMVENLGDNQITGCMPMTGSGIGQKVSQAMQKYHEQSEQVEDMWSMQ